MGKTVLLSPTKILTTLSTSKRIIEAAVLRKEAVIPPRREALRRQEKPKVVMDGKLTLLSWGRVPSYPQF